MICKYWYFIWLSSLSEVFGIFTELLLTEAVFKCEICKYLVVDWTWSFLKYFINSIPINSYQSDVDDSDGDVPNPLIPWVFLVHSKMYIENSMLLFRYHSSVPYRARPSQRPPAQFTYEVLDS